CMDRRCAVLAAVLLCLALTGRAWAQPDVIATTEPPVPKKPQAALEPLPVKSPRPAAEVAKYLEPLTTNDAVFEVTLGQSRLLTLKADLKDQSFVGIGDPTIIDFRIINARQIRIVGDRLGVTDL